MREAIIIGVVVGLLFFAAGAVMTALAVKYATSAILWDVVLWSGIGLMAASTASLILYIWSQTNGGAFWIPVGLLNLGICAIVSGIAYNYSTAPAGDQIVAPKFSWIWEPLTKDQIEAVAAQLKGSPTATVTMAFNARTAGQLASSFDEIFERAGWKVGKIGPSSAVYTGGISGIGQFPNDETGRLLKSAVEANTKLKINFVGLRHEPGGGMFPMMIIGAKPAPSRLPSDLKNELTELGKKLSEAGASVVLLTSDRAREESRLPSREEYGPGIEGSRKHFERGVTFRNETKAMVAQRFQQITYLLGQLELIGIEVPFQVQTSDPDRLGKWLQMVGLFLEHGQVEEARMKAADNDFWFKQ